MGSVYTAKQMLDAIAAELAMRGFRSQAYSKELTGVRVPLHAVKRGTSGSIEEEIVVDVTTSQRISAQDLFPTLKIDGAEVRNASAVTFYLHYFPRAKVYLGIGPTLIRDDGYEQVKNVCRRHGIGLLEVSDGSVATVLEAVPLIDQIRQKASDLVGRGLPSADLSSKLGTLLTSWLDDQTHYVVHYGDPVFKRQEISDRGPQNLSLILIDALQELRNTALGKDIAGRAVSYRTRETREDDVVALEAMKSLWEDHLNVKYPDMQREFEPLLRLDPKYRDHFLHVFQVLLLGMVIIDRLHTEPAVVEFQGRHRLSLDKAWLVASTYHDFNYPIQKYEEWMKAFLKRNLFVDVSVDERHPTSYPFHINVERLMVQDGLGARIQALCRALGQNAHRCAGLCLFEQAVLEKNHGAIAGLTLFQWFRAESCTSVPQGALEQCAMAIALHDKEVWKRFVTSVDGGSADLGRCSSGPAELTFWDRPLQFLLIFCDSVHEWGREGKTDDTIGAELVALSVDGNAVDVTVALEDGEGWENKKRELEMVQRYLHDPRFSITIVNKKTNQRLCYRMTGAATGH